MSQLIINPQWNTSINRVEAGEFISGGQTGLANTAIRQLSENIFYLKETLDSEVNRVNIDTINASITDGVNIEKDRAILAENQLLDSINQINARPLPVNGKSAYEVAVENGFVGSKTLWLNSLKGAAGVIPNYYSQTINTQIPNVYMETDGTYRRTEPNNYSPLYRTLGKGSGDIPTYDANGGLGLQSYIQVGYLSDAPKTITKKMTATVTSLNVQTISLGVNINKILSISVLVDCGNGTILIAGAGAPTSDLVNMYLFGANALGLTYNSNKIALNNVIKIYIVYEV